jgi:hypothetical protein
MVSDVTVSPRVDITLFRLENGGQLRLSGTQGCCIIPMDPAQGELPSADQLRNPGNDEDPSLTR